MQEIELVKRECSHPPLNNGVSDDSFSKFFYSNIEYDFDDMHTDHDSCIRQKWFYKTIQVVGDLIGDSPSPGKTRSQFHNALSTCD